MHFNNFLVQKERTEHNLHTPLWLFWAELHTGVQMIRKQFQIQWLLMRLSGFVLLLLMEF